MEYISAEDISKELLMSPSVIHRKAKSGNWPFIDTPHPSGKGRPVRQFLVSGLPEDIKRKVDILLDCPVKTDNDDDSKPGNDGEMDSGSESGMTMEAPECAVAPPTIRAIETAVAVAAPAPPCLPPAPVAAVSLSLVVDDSALARADLLRLYNDAIAGAEWGRKAEARDRFMTAYNSGIAYPALFEKLGPLSFKTIESWKVAVRRSGNDTAVLADRRGRSSGVARFSKDQEDILIRCMLHPNRPQIAEIIRMARAIMHIRGVRNGHSDSTYRRWIYNWRDNNYPIWVFHRQGEKAWNDECAYYVERDYSLINVGDILVADGHVLNFEVINPWTGKPKRMALILWYDMKSNYPCGWEIMPTEDTAAISSGLRRAIITLGKVPKVVYLDNGRAFRARFFTNCQSFEEAGLAGLYDRLGCKTIFAWPYHGQSKTIERFFGTFGELERWVPTYTGTSIEAKPPRLNRGERLHRRVFEAGPYAGGITLADAHRAIAAWFDEYATRPQKGHLDGAAPIDLFAEGRGPGVDPADLTYLMMSMEIRTVRRNGINFLGQNYYCHVTSSMLDKVF